MDADVALIGYGLWQRRFGGDPGVVGRAVVLNGRPRTIVGVMPRGFRFPYEGEVWTPIVYDPTDGLSRYLLAFGRMRPGIELPAVQAQLTAVSARLALEHPDADRGWRVVATPLRQNLVRGYDRTALALLAVVGFLLLIACVDVASLMLARSAARQREMAIRAAIGASRARQLRQLLVESLLLGLLGGALGLAFALVFRPWLSLLVPPVMSVELAQNQIALDGRVFAFALALSLLTGTLAGVAPGLRAAARDPQGPLREAGRTGRGRVRRSVVRSLVVAQVALAMVLLVGAAGVVEGFRRSFGGPLGFDPHAVLTLRLSLPGSDYATPEARTRAVDEIAARAAALPGVRGVAVSTSKFGLLLATLGVVGILSFAVAQARHEWGVRQALGATPLAITLGLLREGMALVAVGAAAGAFGGAAASGVLRHWRGGLEPLAAPQYAALAGIILAVGLLACLAPARRASRVEPMSALRAE